MVSHSRAARRTPAPRRAHSLDLVEVDADIIVRVVALHCHVYGSLVDARRLGQLPVLLEVSSLVRIILVDDVHLIILVLSQANKHNIARGDPHLLSHLSSDVTKPRHAVEAVALAAPVAEHADDLRVLLAGLLEFELAFGLLVLILAAPPVLAALALILRHDLRVAASSASYCSCCKRAVLQRSACPHSVSACAVVASRAA